MKKHIFKKKSNKSKKKYKKNPALAIVSNPVSAGTIKGRKKGIIMSDRVIELRYIHIEDGKAYKHEFGLGVEMIALDNGSIMLYHPRKKLWGDY